MESLYVESNEESLYRRIERLSAICTTVKYGKRTFDMAFNPKLQDNFLLRPKTIPTFGIKIRSLREDLQINPCQIENIHLPHIPIWDVRCSPVGKGVVRKLCYAVYGSGILSSPIDTSWLKKIRQSVPLAKNA